MKYFWVLLVALFVLLIGVASYGLATIVMNANPVSPAASTPVGKTIASAELLTPHKAVYKIDMVQKSSSAQISNIGGQMYFELKASCDAWETRHRFNLLYDYVETPQMRVSSDFITYESRTGDSFDFNSLRRSDGEDDAVLRGHAATSRSGMPGKAIYSVPDSDSFDLPPGTLFPMAHTSAVLDAAKKGKKFFNAIVFDGSDEEGPVEVNAFIGPAFSEKNFSDGAIDETLLASPAHRIRLAFFPAGNDGADPDYEMDLVLHENGIISDMRVDYHDFSVTQKLTGLSGLESESCG